MTVGVVAVGMAAVTMGCVGKDEWKQRSRRCCISTGGDQGGRQEELDSNHVESKVMLEVART